MHRIDRPGHVNNRFVDGNPELGRPPTGIGQDWLNHIQEEIATVIEEADIELDKAKTNQLHEAILKIAGQAGGAAGLSEEQIREIIANELANLGGDAFRGVTRPVVSGPSVTSLGTPVTLNAAGSHSCFETDAGVLIDHYLWTLPDGSTHQGDSISVTPAGSYGGTVLVKCRAYDALNNASGDATFVLTTATNNAPSATGITSNLPASLVADETYTMTLSGGSDPEGGAVKYKLESLQYCSASSSNNINAPVTLTVFPNATSISFVVRAIDADGAVSANSVTITKTCNQRPVVTGLTVNLAESLVAGDSYAPTITGGSDPEGGITYVAENVQGCSIANAGGFTSPMALTVNAGVTSVSFAVRTKDAAGLLSASSVTITRAVNQRPTATGITTNLPASVTRGQSYTVAVTGGSDPEGGAVKYSFENLVGCTISPDANTSGPVTLVVSTTATSVSFNIRAIDSALLTSSNTVAVSRSGSAVLNRPPLITGVIVDLPSTLTAGETYTATISGGSDPEGGAITYSLSNLVGCSAGVTTGITGAVSISVNPSVTAASFSVKTVAQNGLESASAVTINRAANQRPTATGITTNLPASVTRGQSYTVAVTGGSDPEGGAVKYSFENLVGCTISPASNTAGPVTLTVGATATPVSFDVRAVDSTLLTSSNSVAVSRSGASLVNATFDSGVLPTGSHTLTIAPGTAGTLTLDANGGAGVAASHGIGASAYYGSLTNYAGEAVLGAATQTWDADIPMAPYTATLNGRLFVLSSVGYDPATGQKVIHYSIDSSSFVYGQPTSIWLKSVSAPTTASAGAASVVTGPGINHTAAGAVSGIATVPASVQTTHSISQTSATTLTITVAANGGAVRVRA